MLALYLQSLTSSELEGLPLVFEHYLLEHQGLLLPFDYAHFGTEL